MRLPQEEMALLRQADEAVPPCKFLIKQSDLNTPGFSDGCRGCAAVQADRGRQLHSEGCRKRLELAMEQ